MSLFESATVLRADHAAQALPGGSKLVLKFSHAELSTSSIGIASVPFGYKAAVDGFELGDAGDELSALWALDFGTELKPQPLLQLVAVGSEPHDLLACKCEIGSRGERRGAARIDSGNGLTTPSSLDVFADARGVHEPGRHSRRSGHGWERDRLACCLKVLNGIERTSPLVTAVGSSGGHEGRGASGCHRQLPTATTGI